MDVLSMHTEVTQSLNQVGANRGRKYKDEELDWILNKMQGRFVRSCLKSKDNGGFELDQLRVDDIQNLVVTGQSLIPYIDGTTRYKCFLPYNYHYLLADSSMTKKLCGSETATVENRTLYLDTIRQERSNKGSAKYYVTNVITMKGTTVNVPTNLPYGNTHTGFNSKDDLIFLVPYIALKGGWYWEKAGNYSYPGSYIRLSVTAGSGVNKATVDGTDFTVTSSEVISLQVHTNTGTIRDNRLTSSALIPSLSGNYFYKSSSYSPISELSGDILYIHRDNSFIVSSVMVSYVRKPQPISLSLNTNCELSTGACQAICDLAVEYIKGRVQNVEGQQLAERDIANRVIL